MLCLLVCLIQPSASFNEFRMQQRDSSSAWVRKIPSPQVYYNCIGYQFATESYSSCAVSCSLFVLETAHCTCQTVTTVAAQSHRPGLRSASTSNYVLPRLHTKFGERAFSYAGPRAWNSLPDSVRCAPSIAVFKRRLKTYLFKTAFGLAPD
jgi:hypothetical protein